MKELINNKPILLVSLCIFLLNACNFDDNDNDNDNDSEQTVKTSEQQYPDYALVKNLGDNATAVNVSESGHGFSSPISTLSASELVKHLSGDAHFETSFTTAPNEEHSDLDGLGPVFNNQDCNSCHQRDGRPSTLMPVNEQSRLLLGVEAGIFLRMSINDGDCYYPSELNNFCKNKAVTGFGTQLFHRGVLKAREDWQDNPFIGQANVYLSYEYSDVKYTDGQKLTLKKPIFTIEAPYDVPVNMASDSAILQSDVNYSPRNGMPIFGLGLLELIPDSDILALADPDDTDGDGISGRANWVFDPIKSRDGDSDVVSLGRFGWKASTPSVRVQSLGALRGDMGITNPLFPEESIAYTAMHANYLARTGYTDTGVDIQGEPEANKQFSDEVVFYAETLAVPARRNINNDSVLMGAVIFEQLNCTSCHHPNFVTGSGNILLGGLAAPESLKGQKIYPFTDMLLHDMGEGLADNRRDFTATGREWKTRSLWGIGLTKTVNPAAGFLHDGRASTIEEAILWHGGEALQSKNEFMKLRIKERNNLIAFLLSL